MMPPSRPLQAFPTQSAGASAPLPNSGRNGGYPAAAWADAGAADRSALWDAVVAHDSVSGRQSA
ncbi:hypothetical protein CYL16_23595 [Mycobacterium sp. EPG1]|nr:hypothetical protein CYL16_23595 [Mycobacterium sp. EPG1]